MAATVPANYSERRIIDLENFMQGTHLRGRIALEEFNRVERERSRRPPAPMVKPDPGGLGLKAFLRSSDEEIAKLRGRPDFWKHHEPGKPDPIRITKRGA